MAPSPARPSGSARRLHPDGYGALVVLAAIGLAAALYAHLLGQVTSNVARVAPLPFDAALWRGEKPEPPDPYAGRPRVATVRQRMVDDLIASRVLAGASTQEVVRLLGGWPPNGGFSTRPDGRLELAYPLGSPRGPFRAGLEWLFITFDADVHVSEVLWR